MIPESRLILSELTLRDMALSDDVLLTRKSTIRWIALSLGLISPNESRTLLLDILDILFEFHANDKAPTTKDIVQKLEERGKEGKEKSVYYHLKKLKDTGFVNAENGRYYFGEKGQKKLSKAFEKTYFNKAEKAFSKIEKALNKVENSY